jgi:hypothetical protein
MNMWFSWQWKDQILFLLALFVHSDKFGTFYRPYLSVQRPYQYQNVNLFQYLFGQLFLRLEHFSRGRPTCEKVLLLIS